MIIINTYTHTHTHRRIDSSCIVLRTSALLFRVLYQRGEQRARARYTIIMDKIYTPSKQAMLEQHIRLVRGARGQRGCDMTLNDYV